MKVGHIYLQRARDEDAGRFAALVEALDRLTISQHVLAADGELLRSLQALPFVSCGPSVTSPIMACCLMPDVDIVHIHDDRASQAGLLLTLTRSIPFVMDSPQRGAGYPGPLKRSILNRAHHLIDRDDVDPERLIEIYRRGADAWSELPKNTNCW